MSKYIGPTIFATAILTYLVILCLYGSRDTCFGKSRCQICIGDNAGENYAIKGDSRIACEFRDRETMNRVVPSSWAEPKPEPSGLRVYGNTFHTDKGE